MLVWASMISEVCDMDRKTRIAVIGAGLGGLTVAGFLQRSGFAVNIYEQAPEFSRIGAGIILSANATKVLRRLAVERDLIATGIKPNSYVSRAWDTGETMYEIQFDAASEQRFGGPYLNVHRGDLHNVLERVVAPGTISFDHRLIDVQKAGSGYRLTFGNGMMVDVDLIIGADGINSKVREFILGVEPPRFAGAVAYRAIFPSERLRGFEIADCTKWWGPDRHALPYYMTSRRDEIYVIGVAPAARWESDKPVLPSSRIAFREAFVDFHADFHRVIDAAGDVTLWPIYDRPRNDCWSGGRMVLMGDACHPVRPYMAAGGAMAIEDGAILSRCLETIDDPAEAFRWYEVTRIERVGEVQRISIENSWMRGPTETDWFYCYDPCLAPLTPPA